MNAYEGAPKGRGRLNSKVAPVMSGGSVTPGWGNGDAAAVLFAAEGATVVVVDNRINAMEEIAIIIEGAGGSTIAVAGDSASEKGFAQAVKTAVSTFGRINILHNNIGGQGSVRSLANITFSDLNEIMTLNVASAMLGCREVMPIMMAQGRGSIINISSIASIRHLNTPMAVYPAGKAAIDGFAQNIALQYASTRIRANSVFPGYIDTPFIYRNVKGKPSYAAEASKQRRSIGHPAENRSPWAAWARNRMWRMRHCSWQAMKRPISPARHWLSAAA
jgi:NAD(P)-dependent dehydrogenase (short-subunit alcohol dehydrogenase family)